MAREEKKSGFPMKYVWYGIIGLVFILAFTSYNGLVGTYEAAEEKLSNIEVAYQARMDKTGKIIQIIQGGAEYEKGALTDIIDARAKATSVQLNIDDLTEENMAKFQAAQDQFGASLGKLMAISESYPSLQSAAAFRDFQAQYEGMENRIMKARTDFTEAVKKHNKKLRRFPTNLFNALYGFEKMAYFKASEGAATEPDISFDIK